MAKWSCGTPSGPPPCHGKSSAGVCFLTFGSPASSAANASGFAIGSVASSHVMSRLGQKRPPQFGQRGPPHPRPKTRGHAIVHEGRIAFSEHGSGASCKPGLWFGQGGPPRSLALGPPGRRSCAGARRGRALVPSPSRPAVGRTGYPLRAGGEDRALLESNPSAPPVATRDGRPRAWFGAAALFCFRGPRPSRQP